MRGIGRRIDRLKALAGLGPGEMEAEREKRLREIRKEAERMNGSLRREGKGPAFEVSDNGEVVCSRDGRPVTDFHQTLAEVWYWQTLEWGAPGLVHDEEAETFYSRTGELAISRDRVNLQHLMGDARWAVLGDLRDH